MPYILFIVFLFHWIRASAQHEEEFLTVNELNIAFDRSVIQIITNERYDSTLTYIYRNYPDSCLNQEDCPLHFQIAYSCTAFGPILKNGKILYHVVEIGHNVSTSKAHVEGFNIFLLDKDFIPQFISYSYSPYNSTSFWFNGTYENMLVFQDRVKKDSTAYYYIDAPGMSKIPENNYIEINGKRMCFFKISKAKQKQPLREIYLNLDDCSSCSKAYGTH